MTHVLDEVVVTKPFARFMREALRMGKAAAEYDHQQLDERAAECQTMYLQFVNQDFRTLAELDATLSRILGE
jgi:hypothetical protein